MRYNRIYLPRMAQLNIIEGNPKPEYGISIPDNTHFWITPDDYSEFTKLNGKLILGQGSSLIIQNETAEETTESDENGGIHLREALRKIGWDRYKIICKL